MALITLWWFELIGVIVALLYLIDCSLEGYYYLRALFSKRDLSKYGIGSWALITGSTDGIGLGFAKALAKYGFNIVLVARNPQKLKDAEQELKQFPIQVLCIIKDFSKCTDNPSEFFNDIDKQTQHLDISLVVNNVGTASPGFFYEVSTEALLNESALNLWPIVFLSKIFLNRMLKRNKPSGLINLSSVSSLVPMALLSTYSAGKSFDHLFTLDLNEEIRYLVKKENLQNIDILSLQPGFVETPLIKNRKYNAPLVISVPECVENALRALGKVNYSSVHWKHFIYASILKNLPSNIIGTAFLRQTLKRKTKEE